MKMSLGFTVTLTTFSNVHNNLTQTTCLKKKMRDFNFTYKFTVYPVLGIFLPISAYMVLVIYNLRFAQVKIHIVVSQVYDTIKSTKWLPTLWTDTLHPSS